jgi:hypothetical protein
LLLNVEFLNRFKKNKIKKYTSGNSGSAGSCNFKSSGIGGYLTSYIIDESIDTGHAYGSNFVGNEAWLASQVATNGPVAVCVFVSDIFASYKSGGHCFVLY